MAKLSIFPISLKVSGKTVLVVGGGVEAVNKARLLAKSDAHILVVAPEAGSELVELATQIELRQVLRSDFNNAVAVFVATEDDAERARAVRFAREGNVPLNVVDVPELCDFYTPAIVDRAPISVAISSEGAAPVLARLVRSRIEGILSPDFGRIAQLAGEMRDRVFGLLPDGVARRRFFESLVTSQTVQAALRVGEPEGRRAALKVLDLHAIAPEGSGEVWLIGAGPGAEDLLTLRAQRLLQEADVIVHDQLVPDLVVQMGRRDAKRIKVGKAKGQHSIKQSEINGLLVDLAKKNLKVARLKAGDPMVFGRAHEELEALRANEISYQIVPGITAGLAAAADVALPVTLRRVASGVVFVTAHGADDGELSHWVALAQAGVTLGIYMGKSVLARTATALVAGGMDLDMPVGIVVNAGRENVTSAQGRLQQLIDGEIELSDGPAIVFVGRSVAEGKWAGALRFSQTRQVA